MYKPVFQDEKQDDNQGKLMKKQIKMTIGLALAAICGWTNMQAQTVIAGPTINTSTWGPSGNPYIVAGNCTVPSGQTLTIQPGTVVWMSSGVSITGNGVITAAGTTAQRITFQTPVSSQFWNTIIINNTSGTNQFAYCDFMNATNALDFRGASKNVLSECTFSNVSTGIVFRDNSINAVSACRFQSLVNGIWMTVGANNWAQTSTILNCSFTNCHSVGVYAEAYGNSALVYPVDSWFQNAWLGLTIKNCNFRSCNEGFKFNIWGVHHQDWYASVTGSGYGTLLLMNNVFSDTTNKAIWLSTGNYAGGGTAGVMNNTILNTRSGLVVQDPWDADVKNCLFYGCTNAISRSGTLSAGVSYNDFYNNSTNFTGYSSTYGQILLANRNGTPSDILYNIFSNPLLISTTDFHLEAGSPCIDAGEGSATNSDICFPPSRGSSFNDIGAYGGPGACAWPVVGESPSIVVQPKSMVSCLGQSPQFSVTAAGTAPLSYQWYFGGSPLVAETNASLVLTNVQKSQAGPYFVFISNAFGTATSSTNQLTVNDACIDLHMYAGLTIAGQTGSNYVLSYTTDLANQTWIPLATNLMGNSNWFYLDMDSPFSPHRFYKAVLQQ